MSELETLEAEFARTAGADIVDIGRHGDWDDGSKALIRYIAEEDSTGTCNALAPIVRAVATEHSTGAAE